DGGPVDGREVREGDVADAEPIGHAPARILGGARLDADPGAAGEANVGAGQPAVGRPLQLRERRAETVALVDPTAARVALDEGAVAHEPDDTMRRMRRVFP